MGTLDESCIDRLSCLPDSVLSHILSFLPTRYAIRTSILSTRWRYLYTSVTTLDFYDHHDSSDSFMNSVDRVLFFHDMTCLERFRLRCGGVKTSAYRICGWISFALRRCVQELDLEMNIGDPRDILPASLFMNKTLVKLALHVSNFVMTIPTKVCFPSLKTLHLEYVDFVDEDSIRRLFSGCLVLEEFVMLLNELHNMNVINISNPSLKRLTIKYDGEYGVDNHLNIVIDAPSLVDFKLYDIRAESYSLVKLHSLVNAHLENLFFLVNSNLAEIATNLLKGISNVQALYITPDILRLFTLFNKPQSLFHNLVLLEIGDGECMYWDEIDLTAFLASSPILETLIFDTRGYCYCLSEAIPSCLLSHLKVIEMYSSEHEMDLVESYLQLVGYFLKNASGLEKLKIQMNLQPIQQFEIAKQLLLLPRESKKCQIEIV
ncbi:hypothetical protein PTKIN_Ptkin01aG0023900 [Pterospermum kingtungense]